MFASGVFIDLPIHPPPGQRTRLDPAGDLRLPDLYGTARCRLYRAALNALEQGQATAQAPQLSRSSPVARR